MLLKILRTYRNAFSGLPAAVWILALVWLINRSGSMVLPFMALYVNTKLGYSELLAGMIVTFYGIGSCAGNFFGGMLTSRFGPFRVQLCSLIGTAFGFLTLSQMTSYVGFATVLIATSWMAEIFRPANATAIAEACAPSKHKRAFALNRLAVNLGFAIGPTIGGWFAMFSYQLLFWADALTCLAAAFVFWLLAIRDRQPAKSLEPTTITLAAPARSPYRDLPFLVFLLFNLLTFIVFFQIMAIFPLFLHDEYGLETWHIGLLMGLNTVLIVMFEMVLVHAIDRWNMLRTTAIGSLLMCHGFAVLTLGNGFAWAAVSVLIWTLGEMLAMPQMMAFAGARGNDANRSQYLGLYTTTISLAIVFAPMIGSQCYATDHYLFWHVSLAIGIVVFIGFMWVAQWIRDPLEEKISAAKADEISGETPLEPADEFLRHQPEVLVRRRS